MKRNYFCIVVLMLVSLAHPIFANETWGDKLAKHREWITGNLKIKYSLSNVKKLNFPYHSMSTLNSLGEVKRFAHPHPLIHSIKTSYDPLQRITKIHASFLFEYEGFDPAIHQPQVFTVYRQICIDPLDAANNKSNCVNTEDNVLVDNMQIINIVEVNLEAYNLSSGKYTATTEMIIKQVDADTAYLTDGEPYEFTV